LLALTIAVGSWIFVPGGNWQPSDAQLDDAREKIHAYATLKSEGRLDGLAPWESYTFQYQGRELDGHKIIYVNAFCSEPPAYAAEQMVLVLDGGACYFEAYYDIESRSFVRLVFNGVA
jgi:hypothetical protein